MQQRLSNKRSRKQQPPLPSTSPPPSSDTAAVINNTTITTTATVPVCVEAALPTSDMSKNGRSTQVKDKINKKEKESPIRSDAHMINNSFFIDSGGDDGGMHGPVEVMMPIPTILSPHRPDRGQGTKPNSVEIISSPTRMKQLSSNHQPEWDSDAVDKQSSVSLLSGGDGRGSLHSIFGGASGRRLTSGQQRLGRERLFRTSSQHADDGFDGIGIQTNSSYGRMNSTSHGINNEKDYGDHQQKFSHYASQGRSNSRPGSSGGGLATFFNRPRECAICKSTSVVYSCESCVDFYLCDECRFDSEALKAIHDPAHAILSIQENHCNSSRTFGGESIYSLSGDGGTSSLFYNPCEICRRVLDDTEAVYRCDQCDYIVCQECYMQNPEEATKGTDHKHELKRFQRKSRSNSVHEGMLVTKSRNSDGNKVINDYVVVRLLGRGSYAKVKLVQHIRSGELYALKILRKQRKCTTPGVLGRSKNRNTGASNGTGGGNEDDLLREIAVMKFIDHPNITKLHEVIEDVDSQKVYVIMEYCEKGPVHVLGDAPLPIETARKYASGIASGLLHLHSEFLYHRDIKPANCLVNSKDIVKIADFGTCNSQMRTKLAEGTPAFSSPEQIRGDEVSGDVVDSWAFALTLYEMVFGVLPFDTSSLLQHRATIQSADPIPIPLAGGDAAVRDLLSRMLEKDLSKRLLLSAAASHPFFEGMLGSHTRMGQAKPSSSVLSGSGAGGMSDLYARAMDSVHRGKNLKDCFHGVRALRRIRRKEADTMRNGGSGDDSTEGDEDEDEEDVDDEAKLQEADPFFSSNREYDYQNDGNGSSVVGSRRSSELFSTASHLKRRAREAEDAAVVAEFVEQQLATREPRIDLTHQSLAVPSTLEKLNVLDAVTTDLRLSHNCITSTTTLRFVSFTLLKDISITFNRLEFFPQEVLQAPRLARLDLSHNRIRSIPASLPATAPFLERLNLHHNFITAVGLATPAAAGKQSLLAAPCLRHVRLSGNPLKSLPAALETTQRLELVLDAIPWLMDEWEVKCSNISSQKTNRGGGKPPAVVIWDDAFPVRVPDVDPFVWLATNTMAVYRMQTLLTCQARRIVLCQCSDQRFPKGLFTSEELGSYFVQLRAALLEHRRSPQDINNPQSSPLQGLPPIVRKKARRFVSSYFFATDDEDDLEGGYHSLSAYITEALEAKVPILIVVVSTANSRSVRTSIIAALSTCLTKVPGGSDKDLNAQAELVVNTMRSLYA